MSKYGIFMLGLIVGAVFTAIFKKGRENMENTAVLEPRTLERTESLEEQLINEQLLEAILKSNPEIVVLQADEDGNAVVDKAKHPDLYDWVMND